MGPTQLEAGRQENPVVESIQKAIHWGVKKVGEYVFWRGRRKMLIMHTSFHLLLTTTSWDGSFFFFFKTTAPFHYYFFFYFWLWWVFVAACGLSLVVVCVLSCPTACGVFVPHQGSNPCPLHWRVDSNHWGIPREFPRKSWDRSFYYPSFLDVLDEDTEG